MFKKIRITILSLILVFVSSKTYLQQIDSTDWDEPLVVAIHPVDTRQEIPSERYIRALEAADFLEIEAFMARQAQEYKLPIATPVKIALASTIRDNPPLPPEQRGFLQSVWFSLNFRFWAWRHSGDIDADINMFVTYYDPDQFDEIPHSLALEKGLVGLVFAYSDPLMARTNNFIIAHEMLHTVGATDKYDLSNNMPFYPDGLANPFKQNPWVQDKAEIMGGRIPVGPGLAVIPESLDEVLIGSQTALEIGWYN